MYIGLYPNEEEAARVALGVMQWFKWVGMQHEGKKAADKGAGVQTQIDDFLQPKKKLRITGESNVNSTKEAHSGGHGDVIDLVYYQQLGMVGENTENNAAAAIQNTSLFLKEVDANVPVAAEVQSLLNATF